MSLFAGLRSMIADGADGSVSMMMIVVAGLGTTVAEKFAPKK